MRIWNVSPYLAPLAVFMMQGVRAQEPPVPAARQLLFVANGLGASIQAFRVLAGGELQEVPGSPFPAPQPGPK